MILKVASFNLFQFCAPPFSWYFKKDTFNKNEWEIKTKWVESILEDIDCDIIGFQEVFSQDELKRVVRSHGFNYFITVDKPKFNKDNPKIYTTTTVALASKFPIKTVEKIKPEVKTCALQIEQFSFSREPIKAMITLPNSLDITVYVNHFKSNRLNEFEYIFKKDTEVKKKKEKILNLIENLPSQKQRLIETSLIYEDIKRVKTPIISLCDLNDKEFSLALDSLTSGVFNIKGSLQELFDPFYIFENKKKRVATSYYKGVGNIIDYIHLSKEFFENENKVLSYKVFDKHLVNNPNGSLLQSDHAIISCEISLT